MSFFSWLRPTAATSVGKGSIAPEAPQRQALAEPANPARSPQPARPAHGASSPARVGQFYAETTDKFLQVYGEVIHAFRSMDVTKLLDYQIESIGFTAGQHVFDAGCGVCGPATYFAKNAGVTVV